MIDRMMATPAVEKASVDTAQVLPPTNPPVFGSKGISVERSALAKEPLDEAADLFKAIFKGEIIP